MNEPKVCETHGMYGDCPDHSGPYDTPKPELNVEAAVARLRKYSQSIAFEHELNKLSALIQQVSDQRVRKFAEALLASKGHLQFPDLAFDAVLAATIPQTLADYLSHKETK